MSTILERLAEIQAIIASDYGCTSTHLHTCWVRETCGDELWEGDIEVFSVEGHATASYCYAWHAEHGAITTLLLPTPSLTPRAAVRIALAARASRRYLRD